MLKDKIRKLCADRGMSVAVLEEKCDIMPGTIKKWDGDTVKSPRATTLYRVAQVLGVTVEDLLIDRKDA